MARVLILAVCLMLVLVRVEPCSIPESLYVFVPQTIPAQHEITRVYVADCDSKTMELTQTDPSLTIQANGVIVAVADVYVGTGRRTFYVRVRDGRGPESEMKVHLVHTTLRESKPKNDQVFLKRSKRRWSPPPFNILENDKGPFPKQIEKIVSDSEVKHDVYYTISGPGYDQNPLGLFTLDPQTGLLFVHNSVDREVYPQFKLTTRVFDIKTNAETDLPLDIEILVDDVNDNAPEFSGPLQVTVLEQSRLGSKVGKLNATDKDAENTLHSKIKYSLLTGYDLFSIDPQTGVITTLTNTLDREVNDKHLVTVQIKDMDGAVNGLFTTGTATITVGDINDNPPTFTKASYSASVKENDIDKLILRIPVEDKDLINTPNWISKFAITKGNENGNFRIETDPKTNDGLLYVAKPLNYEKTQSINLEVMARNEADLIGSTATWQSVPVAITVTDVDEGPEFIAPTIRFNVKENTPNGTKIGTYIAVDPETKSSDGIKYYKVADPAGWINVNRNTGDLTVANTIDRESQFVQNGIYNIPMKAVDASSKSGSGTVIIFVEDVNDNIPLLPTKEQLICEKDKEFGSVLIVAEDKDESPFSSPFTFSLPKDHDGKWSVTKFNDTTATLKHVKELPTGIYKVPIDVTDLQGSGKRQTVTAKICQCRNGVCVAKDRSTSLGGLGWLALLLPLLLLLLLCLLLAFFCVTKREKMEFEDTADSGGILLKSNTEGKGDEVDASLITVPTYVQDDITKGTIKDYTGNGYDGIKGFGTLGGHGFHQNYIHKEYNSGHYRDQYAASGVGFDNRHLVQDSSTLQTWQANGRFLHQKLAFLGTEEDGRYADDYIKNYGYEGIGSAAGSVGCCSNLDDMDNLDFLNALGPKFKTLADVCTKT